MKLSKLQSKLFAWLASRDLQEFTFDLVDAKMIIYGHQPIPNATNRTNSVVRGLTAKLSDSEEFDLEKISKIGRGNKAVYRFKVRS